MEFGTTERHCNQSPGVIPGLTQTVTAYLASYFEKKAFHAPNCKYWRTLTFHAAKQQLFSHLLCVEHPQCRPNGHHRNRCVWVACNQCRHHGRRFVVEVGRLLLPFRAPRFSRRSRDFHRPAATIAETKPLPCTLAACSKPGIASLEVGSVTNTFKAQAQGQGF
jgi:hypothetical protein